MGGAAHDKFRRKGVAGNYAFGACGGGRFANRQINDLGGV